ncbi:MAG: VCBS repeat-containing protein [Deltaproteobacteria bacterium]
MTADLTIEACETAPAWTFDGRLHLGDRCLEAAGSGEVQLTICTDDLAQRFFVDDEGHVWSAVVPGPQPGMDYAHVSCLAPTATGIRTQLCGRDQGAPTWTFAPLEVSTPRTALLAASSEIRLGDIDGDGFGDLCALENAMLVCASGNGAGGFQTLATARFALAIEPLSLALGDVDRDGRIDACGRDADGIVCALAANNFVSTRWSTQLQTNSTLAVVGSYVCGINTDGVQCASQTDARTLSVWPPADSTVWPADFDGDGQPDWCDTSTASPACGVAAESAVTTDGSPWSFSVGGSLDASDDGVAVGDLDGDGRADLCSLDGAAIKCARSQGRGFGPRVTFAHLSSPATALWIGDLDGDGRADACVDSGLTIDCAIP